MNETPQRPHRGLHIFGKIIAAVLIFIFVIFSLAQILVLGIYSTLLSGPALTRVLTDGTVYREVTPIATEELSSQLKSSTGNEALVKQLPTLVPQVVSEAYFNSTLTNVIGNVSEFITGRSSTLAVTIDTAPLRKSLTEAYQKVLKDAPVCADEQVDGDFLCRPRDIDASQLLTDPKTKQQIAKQVESLVPEKLPLSDIIAISTTDSRTDSPLAHVQEIYQIVWRVVFFGTPILILLLLLASLIGPETLRGHFLFFGIGLMIPSLIMLLVSIFGLGFVNGGGVPLPVEDLPAAEGAHVQTIAEHIISQPLSSVLWISIGGLAVSLAAIIAGILLGAQKRTKKAS